MAVALARKGCAESIPNGCALQRELAVGRFTGWMTLWGVSALVGVIVFISAPTGPSNRDLQVALRPR